MKSFQLHSNFDDLSVINNAKNIWSNSNILNFNAARDEFSIYAIFVVGPALKERLPVSLLVYQLRRKDHRT